jgi:uncharacterized protein GlcG (DUF336 family)
MAKAVALLGALALAALATSSSAQQAAPAQPRVPPAKGPTMALSLEAAQTAIATCTANGFTVAVSLVDSAGVLKALVAADGASKGAVESSTKKAVTANALKMPSSEVQEKIKTDQALAAKVSADTNLFARAGALPLMAGTEQIGAIGVGGAPGGDKDEACAKAGLDKIKDRLK